MQICIPEVFVVKQSWAVLQSMSPSKRLEAVTRVLRNAHRSNKLGLFSADGTMNRRPLEAYSLLFPGQVDMRQASNLTRQLLNRGVLCATERRGYYALVLTPTVQSKASVEAGLTASEKTEAAARPQPVEAAKNNALEDQLSAAHQRATTALAENQQHLANIGAALAVRNLLVEQGVEPDQFGAIFKIVEDHR